MTFCLGRSQDTVVFPVPFKSSGGKSSGRKNCSLVTVGHDVGQFCVCVIFTSWSKHKPNAPLRYPGKWSHLLFNVRQRFGNVLRRQNRNVCSCRRTQVGAKQGQKPVLCDTVNNTAKKRQTWTCREGAQAGILLFGTWNLSS